MKILILDTNHPCLIEKLQENGFSITEDYTSSYDDICNKIAEYEGIILRSRIPIDKNLLEKASHLQFIARVGAGMENIDVSFAKEKNISLINAPEGNRESVAEHAMGMLLSLLHKINTSNNEVKKGIWKREENRGVELMEKTIGIIGYGNTGKAFAKRLSGFSVKVVFYDILTNLEDKNAIQVSLEELQQQTDIISLHVPLTKLTCNMINQEFIKNCSKPFYILNTARGKCVVTKDLVEGLENKKILGACLDVLEHEKSSFENLSTKDKYLQKLLEFENVIITPHIAGWTYQSHKKLAEVVVDKILTL